jgi:hypothetical protein
MPTPCGGANEGGSYDITPVSGSLDAKCNELPLQIASPSHRTGRKPLLISNLESGTGFAIPYVQGFLPPFICSQR